MSSKPIFTLYGPQGIGKTTHAKTIAKALWCDLVDDGLGESTYTEAGTLRITNDDTSLDDVWSDKNTPHIVIKVKDKASLEALIQTLRRASP